MLNPLHSTVVKNHNPAANVWDYISRKLPTLILLSSFVTIGWLAADGLGLSEKSKNNLNFYDCHSRLRGRSVSGKHRLRIKG